MDRKKTNNIPVYKSVDKKRVFFQVIKSDNPANVGGVAGYISNCFKCGDLILTRLKIESTCVDCAALTILVETPKKFARFYRSGAWRRLRACVFLKKGNDCVYCQGFATHVDHSTPIRRGGTNEVSNLQPVCGSCNSKKHRKTHEEFLSTRKHKVGYILLFLNLFLLNTLLNTGILNNMRAV